MKKDVTLSSNVIKEEKGTTISYKELQIRCDDILLKIKNNKLEECSESADYIKGYNLSLNDIEKNIKNIILPTKDISSSDDGYLETLEILYRLESLNKSVDTTVSTFKTLGKVENGKQ